ncbi:MULTISPECIES: 4-oxalocrotonate tautomerase family protein [unclassified Rhizobacter]|uniref:tautomerase family protein n=1 Tax=unclassified Rhizobacter TaxID=2640088 RepID=UPI0006FADAB7|nr:MULTISPECIES: 4-oxalocrotonate tautomerase family protein [unclassified Rhizobacter]KQU78347.1 4-oxalocrotonate tautomerase [Rhizobacter sp. Root29]KQW10867.1 4-oxalocrotonate tautomerase [Rhizobacter sp. Root1238]KRB25213.1 4-oxalocrotonate tautomerase [Rhizobacter sp. Root16D2]
MPYLHIQVSGEADDALAANVARSATDLTARLLGKDPSLTAVVVDFIAPSKWFIGGRALAAGGPRSYHWMVSITDETNTKREKAVYLDAVHATMRELLGGVAEHSYVHVADLRASAYGFAGLTQEHRYQHPA